MPSLLDFLHSQVFTEVPFPAREFTGRTIIITGSNTGLGFEAAKHLVRLDASKVNLAVRNPPKGEAAATAIEESTGREGVVEVWELDLTSYASVKSFADRAKGLDRLDVLINNAGVMTYQFIRAEKDDIMITVNVVSPLLLGLLLLPKLKETSLAHHKSTVLTFTGSLGHSKARLVEGNSDRIFETLAAHETARMTDRQVTDDSCALRTEATGLTTFYRYNVSKLILLQLVRELAGMEKRSGNSGKVTISVVNPGVPDTELARNVGWLHGKILKTIFTVIERTPETASQTIVLAAEGNQEAHGQYSIPRRW